MSSIKATIDRFEDGKAVIIFDDGEQIIISNQKIGSGFKEGDIIYLSFSSDGQALAGRQKTVRSILNGILKKDGQA